MFFLLYAHNQIVEGKKKAAIYDLENSNIINIPNVIVPIIEEMRSKTVDEIKQKYTPDNPEIIDKYINFFLEKELGFYTKEPARFPQLDTNFYYPGTIQNAIIEVNFKSYDVKNSIEKLDTLGCRYLEIRLKISTQAAIDKLNELLQFAADTIFISIDLLVKYNKLFTPEFIKNLHKTYPKIGKIVVHEAPEDEEVSEDILFSKHTFKELDAKHTRTSKYVVNIPFFCESLQFNTTYNKKVSINYKGQIKNILKDKHNYGTVNETDLIDVCKSQEFQKLWHVTPDQIEQLKDDPLRYAVLNPFPIKEITPNKFEILNV